MNMKKCFVVWLSTIFFLVSQALGDGILLLYRPLDISNDCAQSEYLRYDISFGMGMSDTITLVFHTLNEVDYKCGIEIASEPDIFILIVIRFPRILRNICKFNPDSFLFENKSLCVPICQLVDQNNLNTSFFVVAVKQTFRFRFVSNSSINSNINANVYQITATSARNIDFESECNLGNETYCHMNNMKFCFTTGVVCDGIKNCGVTDWYDERRNQCGLPEEQLGTMAVVAVMAASCLALLAIFHLVSRCLPPTANSFFIFNENEDNRLCIDPVYKPSREKCNGEEKSKRMSLIPVFSSSSSSLVSGSDVEQSVVIAHEMQNLNMSPQISSRRQNFSINETRADQPENYFRRTTTMRNMTAKLHKLLTGGREQRKPNYQNTRSLDVFDG